MQAVVNSLVRKVCGESRLHVRPAVRPCQFVAIEQLSSRLFRFPGFKFSSPRQPSDMAAALGVAFLGTHNWRGAPIRISDVLNAGRAIQQPRVGSHFG